MTIADQVDSMVSGRKRTMDALRAEMEPDGHGVLRVTVATGVPAPQPRWVATYRGAIVDDAGCLCEATRAGISELSAAWAWIRLARQERDGHRLSKRGAELLSVLEQQVSWPYTVEQAEAAQRP